MNSKQFCTGEAIQIFKHDVDFRIDQRSNILISYIAIYFNSFAIFDCKLITI
jgi:hypothetical protein